MEDTLKSRYRKWLNEYRAVLTKLAEMAFILGTDYKYILEERKRVEENRKGKVEKVDRHALLEALDFVNKVANRFESFPLGDQNVIPAIKNWDNIGDSVFSDINSWMRLYIEKHLPENRKKEVEEFIGENNRWIEEHTEAFAA